MQSFFVFSSISLSVIFYYTDLINEMYELIFIYFFLDRWNDRNYGNDNEVCRVNAGLYILLGMYVFGSLFQRDMRKLTIMNIYSIYNRSS